ncbi:hypothetical protein [Amycolatopsis kentuckyensis]|uniref:hypothetical protein n=1 Tax=Amycolatopsis kentuckyensis TaxID=218823 RepID=UPI003561FCEE
MGDRNHADGAVRRLRGRWRLASTTSGWRFPSDWAVPEVDTVCSSALFRGDLTAALTVLGRARARTGAGLDETLYDVAALHTVLDGCADAAQPAMLRAAAIGWANAVAADPRPATVAHPEAAHERAPAPPPRRVVAEPGRFPALERE